MTFLGGTVDNRPDRRGLGSPCRKGMVIWRRLPEMNSTAHGTWRYGLTSDGDSRTKQQCQLHVKPRMRKGVCGDWADSDVDFSNPKDRLRMLTIRRCFFRVRGVRGWGRGMHVFGWFGGSSIALDLWCRCEEGGNKEIKGEGETKTGIAGDIAGQKRYHC